MIFNSINYSISQQSKQREKAAVCDFISLVMFFYSKCYQKLLLLFRNKKPQKNINVWHRAADFFIHIFHEIYIKKIIFIVDNSKPIMVKVQQENRWQRKKRLKSHKFGEYKIHTPTLKLNSLINRFNDDIFTLLFVCKQL